MPRRFRNTVRLHPSSPSPRPFDSSHVRLQRFPQELGAALQGFIQKALYTADDLLDFSPAPILPIPHMVGAGAEGTESKPVHGTHWNFDARTGANGVSTWSEGEESNHEKKERYVRRMSTLHG